MKIKIHLITQVYLILCLVSGYFYEVMTMYLCLIVHEIGHFVMIRLFKKKIDLLEISPLGGILHIDECQNDHNYKELFIYLGGPIASCILYFVLNHYSQNEILIKSSFYVLILNLLPILPLDGARIIMCVKQYVLPYRWVLKIVTSLSILSSIALIIFYINNLNYVIILTFFLYLSLRQYINIPYDYYHFLFYKFFHPNHKLKTKLMMTSKKTYSLFYKGFNNLFFINNHFISEEELLGQYIKKNHY